MDLDITHGAVFVGLQVAHDASFADLGVWTERGQSEACPAQACLQSAFSSHHDPVAQDCAQAQCGNVNSHIWPVVPSPALGGGGACISNRMVSYLT